MSTDAPDDTPENSVPAEGDVLLSGFLGVLDAVEAIEAESQVEMTMPLTISVRGLVVTGTLVSARAYFAWLANSYARSFSGIAMSQAMQTRIALQLRNFGEMHSDPPRYLHLKNARFVQGQSVAPLGDGLWWRVRLDAVDGFSLQSLDVEVHRGAGR